MFSPERKVEGKISALLRKEDARLSLSLSRSSCAERRSGSCICRKELSALRVPCCREEREMARGRVWCVCVVALREEGRLCINGIEGEERMVIELELEDCAT